MIENKIALGTAQLDQPYGINNQNQSSDPERAQSILDLAYSQGIRSLDTARAYGHSLEFIGNSPHPFQVFSKFLQSEQSIFEAIEEHKQKLKNQTLICLSFHRYHEFTEFSEWSKLNSLTQEFGLQIGVSVGSDEEAMNAINSRKVQWIQLPFNLLDNAIRKSAIFDAAKQAQVKLQVRSLFLQGLFFMDQAKVPIHLADLVPALDQLKEIAKSYELPLEELALRYGLSFPEIASMTFGVDQPEHLVKNGLVISKGSLPSKVIHDIHAIKVKNTKLLNPAIWNTLKK